MDNNDFITESEEDDFEQIDCELNLVDYGDLVEGELDGCSLRFDGETETPLFDSEGILRRMFLRSDTDVDGISYKANTWLTLFKQGYVHTGTLAEDQYINGAKFAKGSVIAFHKPLVFSYGTLAENYTVTEGINVFEFIKGNKLRFHINGKVHSGYLAETISLLSPYNFTVNKGSRISFRSATQWIGQVRPLKFNFSIGGTEYQADGRYVGFYAADFSVPLSLRIIKLNKPTRIQGHYIYKRVGFYVGTDLVNAGPVYWFRYANTVLWKGYTIQKQELVTLHTNGVYKQFMIGKSKTIYKVSFPKGTVLFFRKNTRVKGVRVSARIVIEGVSYPKGSEVWFDNSGRVTPSEPSD